MVDILDRVRNKALQSKIVTPEEAADFIKPGMTLATSGFTSSAYPKAVPLALADRMKKDPFTVNIMTGASTGPEFDEALASVHGIKKRLPFQTDKVLRSQINDGTVDYIDIHLSEVAQLSRCGYLGNLDVAVIEACAITEEGNIIPTTAVGNSASFVQTADTVIVEVNNAQPLEFEGMHDVYLSLDPPNRLPIPIVRVDDRIGTPYIPCPQDKIRYIVPCDIADHTRSLAPLDATAQQMADLTIDFLKREIKAGRMPKNLLPLQSGVGNVANAVTAGFVHSDFRDLTVYTEVIQDGMLDLIDAGKLNFASGTAFSPSPEGMARFFKDIEKYKKYMILRPQEISNSAEVIRRLGVISMNTPLEFDILCLLAQNPGKVFSTDEIFKNVWNAQRLPDHLLHAVSGQGRQDLGRRAILLACRPAGARRRRHHHGAGRGRPARQVAAPARQGDHRELRAPRLPSNAARLLPARRREDTSRAHAAPPR